MCKSQHSGVTFTDLQVDAPRPLLTCPQGHHQPQLASEVQKRSPGCDITNGLLYSAASLADIF